MDKGEQVEQTDPTLPPRPAMGTPTLGAYTAQPGVLSGQHNYNTRTSTGRRGVEGRKAPMGIRD